MQAVVAARWGHAVLEHQGAIDLVVHIHRLEAIHFIFVDAGAEVEFVVANVYIEAMMFPAPLSLYQLRLKSLR